MRIHSRSRRRRGAASVEFAMVAPLFLLILAGIIEFGQAFFIQNSLANVSRRGARSAIVDGSSTPGVIAEVRAQCESLFNIQGSKFTVEVAVNGNTGLDLTQAEPGDEVRVTVKVPLSEVGVGFFASMFSSTVLDALTIMEHE